ncbi:MAG: transport inner rane component protein [Paucimonas sp.]|nr:transport inner rane component protein [Paucimonas sp.]
MTAQSSYDRCSARPDIVKRLRTALRRSLPASFLLLTIFLLWWAATALFGVPSYLLPSPLKVASTFIEALGNGTLLQHALATCSSWLLGFAIGALFAISISVAVSEIKLVERLVMPLVLALQAVPKIAVAPLVFVWIGFGQPAIITMAALTAYFPVLMSAITGLKAYDRDLESLYRTFGSSRMTILCQVKIPGAARASFAGIELGLVFSLIGTVVMEFIVGTKGLGFMIQESANNADLPLNFAGILALGVCGVSFSAALSFLRRKLIYWENTGSGRSSAHA